MSIAAEPEEVYGDPITVRSPDGRAYFARVLPAGFGDFPLIRSGFGLGVLAFAVGWIFAERGESRCV